MRRRICSAVRRCACCWRSAFATIPLRRDSLRLGRSPAVLRLGRLLSAVELFALGTAPFVAPGGLQPFHDSVCVFTSSCLGACAPDKPSRIPARAPHLPPASPCRCRAAGSRVAGGPCRSRSDALARPSFGLPGRHRRRPCGRRDSPPRIGALWPESAHGCDIQRVQPLAVRILAGGRDVHEVAPVTVAAVDSQQLEV